MPNKELLVLLTHKHEHMWLENPSETWQWLVTSWYMKSLQSEDRHLCFLKFSSSTFFFFFRLFVLHHTICMLEKIRQIREIKRALFLLWSTYITHLTFSDVSERNGLRGVGRLVLKELLTVVWPLLNGVSYSLFKRCILTPPQIILPSWSFSCITPRIFSTSSRHICCSLPLTFPLVLLWPCPRVRKHGPAWCCVLCWMQTDTARRRHIRM